MFPTDDPRPVPRWLGYLAVGAGVVVNELTLELAVVPDGELGSPELRAAVVLLQIGFVLSGLHVLLRRPRSRIPWDRIVLATASGALASFATFAVLDTQFPGALDLPGVRYFSVRARYVPDSTLVMVPRESRREVRTKLRGDLYQAGDTIPPLNLEYRATFNDLGFRTNSAAPPYDVVVIGDSFVEFGERDTTTLSEMLGDATGLGAFNLGRAWYGPHQYLELLRRHGVELTPKFAILCFFEGNDFTDMEQYRQWREGGDYYRFSAVEHGLLKRFFIAGMDLLDAARRVVGRWIGDPPERRWGSALYQRGDRPVRMKFAYWPDVSGSRQILRGVPGRTLADLLREFRAVATRNDIVPMVVFIPSKLTVYREHLTELEGEALVRAIQEMPGRSPARAALETLTREAGVEFIDLTPDFRRGAAAGALLYYPVDTHWTKVGRRLAAEIIGDRLTGQEVTR